jgi:hypothetical protein
MKQFIYILILSATLLSSSFAIAKMPDNNVESIEKEKTERYIKYVYENINFKKVNKLSYDCFKYAYTGYLNLVEAGKIRSGSLLTVCDFTLSSNVKRLWTIDVQKHKVIYNTLVAHGSGTGEEYATRFSNLNDSHQSSLGFYVTGVNYIGDNGLSMKLHGVDGNFNNNAFDRGIVVHGADYVSEQYAKDNIRLGRSWGCPALARSIAEPMMNKLQNGSCLFIYHTTKQYLKTSYWINNKVKNLPSDSYMMDLKATINTNPRYVENSREVKKDNSKEEEDDIEDTDGKIELVKPTIKTVDIVKPKILTKEEQEQQILSTISDVDKKQYKVSVQTISLSKEEVELYKKKKNAEKEAFEKSNSKLAPTKVATK